jgi:hypothetical protein
MLQYSVRWADFFVGVQQRPSRAPPEPQDNSLLIQRVKLGDYQGAIYFFELYRLFLFKSSTGVGSTSCLRNSLHPAPLASEFL